MLVFLVKYYFLTHTNKEREHSDEFEIHGGFEQKRQYFVRNNLHRQGEKQTDAHKLTNS